MKYDYRCESCGADFVIELPMDTPIVRAKHVGARCTVCKSSRVRKKIHRVSIRFTGTGFYSTDNRKEEK